MCRHCNAATGSLATHQTKYTPTMRFLLTLLRPMGDAQFLQQCAAVVKTLTERRKSSIFFYFILSTAVLVQSNQAGGRGKEEASQSFTSFLSKKRRTLDPCLLLPPSLSLCSLLPVPNPLPPPSSLLNPARSGR